MGDEPAVRSSERGWVVEYAKSGRSKCAITTHPIEEGALRVGKEVNSLFAKDKTIFVWHEPTALFGAA